MTPKSDAVQQPRPGETWRRRRDNVLVQIVETPGAGASAYTFSRVRNLATGRHFEVTVDGLLGRYERVDS